MRILTTAFALLLAAAAPGSASALTKDQAVQALEKRFGYTKRTSIECLGRVFDYHPVYLGFGPGITLNAATILYMKASGRDGQFGGIAAEYLMPKADEPANAVVPNSQTGQSLTSVNLDDTAQDGFVYNARTLPPTFPVTDRPRDPKEDAFIHITHNWRRVPNPKKVRLTCGPDWRYCPCVANYP